VYTLPQIIDGFDEAEDWDDMQDLLITLGHCLPYFPEEHKIWQNSVSGCKSSTWLYITAFGEPLKIKVHATGESIISRGLCHIIMSMFDTRTSEQVLATNARAIYERIRVGRFNTANDFFEMVKIVKITAHQLLQPNPSSLQSHQNSS